MRSVKDSLKDSLRVSSITGVNYLVPDGQRSIFERCFWLIVLVTMVALATSQGLQVYMHYKERPVVTIEKSNFDGRLPYPSATICVDYIKTDEELKEILQGDYHLTESILNTDYDDFINYLKDLAFKDFTTYHEYAAYANGTKKDYLNPTTYMEVLDQVVPSNQKTASKLSVNLFHKDTRPIERIFTEIGPCIVTNPNISIYYTLRYFNSSISYNGFKPIYYVMNDRASMNIQKPENINRGNIFFQFHAPNEIMEILDRRNVIPHNTMVVTHFESEHVITSEDVLPLSTQQKNCRLPYDSNDPPLQHSPVYSYNLCKFECRIRIALKHCNCTPYYYRRTADEPICNLTGLFCLSKFKAQLLFTNDSMVQCPVCPQNCDVSMYLSIQKEAPYQFVKNALKTEVIYPKKIYVRNLIFSKIDLIVQIGGIFGLFLGCSLLSIIEIIYSLTLRILFAKE